MLVYIFIPSVVSWTVLYFSDLYNDILNFVYKIRNDSKDVAYNYLETTQLSIVVEHELSISSSENDLMSQ